MSSTSLKDIQNAINNTVEENQKEHCDIKSILLSFGGISCSEY